MKINRLEPLNMKVCFLLLVVLLAWLPRLSLAESAGTASLFTCPMHPHYIANEFGACPICGMDLVAMPSDSASMSPASMSADGMSADTMPAHAMSSGTDTQSAQALTQYTCPMHPHYIANEFGACPICGMDLVEMPGAGSAGESMASGPSSAMSADQMDHLPVVSVSAEMIQTMGIVTEIVERDLLPGRVRLYSELEANPRLLTNLSGRVEGWISRLNVQAVGDRVTKGDVLFVLESPTLLTAQKEYINALASQRQSRIQAAEQRLKALGVDRRVIDALRQRRKPNEEVPFYAAQSGVVSHIEVVEGDYIRPGSHLLSVQSYRQLWLQAYVPEEVLHQVDDTAEFDLGLPNTEGSIEYAFDTIYPSLDERTRSGVVRLRVENPEDRLRPGQLLEVSLKTDKADVLSVPSQAVIHHSSAQYVVLDLGEGRYRPQPIEAGIVQGGRTEILQGLTEGDQVVSSGQFMLDSESNLRDAFQKMQRRRLPLDQISVSKRDLGLIDHLADAAVYLHKRIKADRTVKAMMLEPAIDITDTLMPQFHGTQLEVVMRQAQNSIKPLFSDASQRQAKASLGSLVDALTPWLQDGQPEHYQNLGVELYQDLSSGKGWLELKKMRLNSKPYNPYANSTDASTYRQESLSATAESRPMTDSDSAPPPMSQMGLGGAHAHH